MHQGKIIVLAAVLMLAACRPSPTEDAELPDSGSSVAAAPVAQVTPAVEARSDTSPLLDTLALFASEPGQHWDAYVAVPGVIWLENAPVEYMDGKYAQKGRLLLAGFGAAKLPNGKTGADYAMVEGNEGESGATLDGDSERVHAISVRKFYFSEDYQGILQRQIGTSNSIKRIADSCTPEEDAEVLGNNAFFEVSLSGGQTVYVEAFLEAGGKYSPGYTVFDFQRDKPIARISQLGCRVL